MPKKPPDIPQEVWNWALHESDLTDFTPDWTLTELQSWYENTIAVLNGGFESAQRAEFDGERLDAHMAWRVTFWKLSALSTLAAYRYDMILRHTRKKKLPPLDFEIERRIWRRE